MLAGHSLVLQHSLHSLTHRRPRQDRVRRLRREQGNGLVESQTEQAAAPRETPSTAGAGQKAGELRVRAGERELCIPLTELDAVIECPPLTRVPAGPAWLVGVAGRKGKLLPVADLGALVSEGARAPSTPGPRLLLVESGAHLLAFSVDEILSESLDAPPGDAPATALRDLAERLLESPPTGADKSQPDAVPS